MILALRQTQGPKVVEPVETPKNFKSLNIKSLDSHYVPKTHPFLRKASSKIPP